MYVSYFVLGRSWVGARFTYLTTLWSLCHLYSRESVRYVLYSILKLSFEVSVFCLVASPLRHFSGKKTDSRPLLYPGTAERILNWEEGGGGSQARVRGANLKGGFGNPPPGNFEARKFYFHNLIFFIFHWNKGRLSPHPPRLRRPWHLTTFESISVIGVFLFPRVRIHWICRVASVRRLFRNVRHPIGNEDFTSRGWTWLRGMWRQGEGLGSTISRQQTKMERAMPNPF